MIVWLGVRGQQTRLVYGTRSVCHGSTAGLHHMVRPAAGLGLGLRFGLRRLRPGAMRGHDEISCNDVPAVPQAAYLCGPLQRADFRYDDGRFTPSFRPLH